MKMRGFKRKTGGFEGSEFTDVPGMTSGALAQCSTACRGINPSRSAVINSFEGVLTGFA